MEVSLNRTQAEQQDSTNATNNIPVYDKKKKDIEKQNFNKQENHERVEGLAKNYSSQPNNNKDSYSIEILDFKLYVNLNQQNFTIEKLNHILLYCPQQLKFLHISIENTISNNNFELKLKHLQNLKGFKFTFAQTLNKQLNQEQPIICVNESFLQLDKLNFKIVNLELNGNLGLTSFSHFFNQFTEYEELNLKVIVQDCLFSYQREIILDELQFSQNLNSLTLFFQNLRIFFGQNFGKITQKLKYFKFIPIQCQVYINQFIKAISVMNKESQVILDFSQQEIDENDLARINDAIYSRS